MSGLGQTGWDRERALSLPEVRDCSCKESSLSRVMGGGDELSSSPSLLHGPAGPNTLEMLSPTL